MNNAPPKSKGMYFFIIFTWIVASSVLWIDFVGLLFSLDSVFSIILYGFLISYIDLGWLYGLYHIGILLYGLLISEASSYHTISVSEEFHPSSIAILYTTCDDFQFDAAYSCVSQE